MPTDMRTEIHLPADTDRQRLLFGPNDSHFRMLKAELGVTLVARKGRLIIDGDEDSVSRALNVVERMLEAIDKGQTFVVEEVATLMERHGEEAERSVLPWLHRRETVQYERVTVKVGIPVAPPRTMSGHAQTRIQQTQQQSPQGGFSPATHRANYLSEPAFQRTIIIP